MKPSIRSDDAVRSGGMPASAYGHPAVCDHHVVGVRVDTGRQAVKIVHGETGEPAEWLPVARAQVWARAGRITLSSWEGKDRLLVLLASSEAGRCHVGDAWPEHSGAIAGVEHAVGSTVHLMRSMRIAHDRNAAVDAFIAELHHAMPGVPLLYPSPAGIERDDPEKLPADGHKGLLGHEGWPR